MAEGEKQPGATEGEKQPGATGGEKQPGAEGQPAQDVSWAKVAAVVGAAASLVGVLAFFGINNFTQLKQALSSATTPAVTTPAAAAPSGGFNPTPSSPASTASSPATYTPAPPATPAFDPGTLNSEQTDQTPFTEAALFPSAFTDSQGIHFSLAAGGERACINSSMSSNVQYLLNNSGCTAVMTGDYLADSGVVTATSEVLVSAQVFPLANASTASQVYSALVASRSWDFGIWCPVSGLGAEACGTGYSSAQRREYLRTDHRYLIEAEALYTDRTQNPVVDPWISAAAKQAADTSGPENYAGNS